jgi:LysM repeat protein
MNSPQYAVLKLINGDELLCTFVGEDETHILVLFPMLVKAIPKLKEGRVLEAISLAPYTHFAADDEYTFAKSQVVFIKNLSERYYDTYKVAVEDFLTGIDPTGPTTAEELKDALNQLGNIFGDQVSYEDNQTEETDSIFIDDNSKSIH